MAIVLQGSASGVGVEADTYADSVRTTMVPRAGGYSVNNVTGTMAAALGANSSVFAMRLDPSAGLNAFIEKVHLRYVTVVAYTTPLTVSRRLALFRGSGAATSGGTTVSTVAKKHSTLAGSECEVAQGGSISIATTAALTVTSITYEADPLATFNLTHVGAAGAYYEALLDFVASPIILEPGQLLAVRNIAAMDAAGTWQLEVGVQWFEGAAY